MRKRKGFGTTRAVFHRLDDIDVYQITGEQLEHLEKSSTSDLFLEIALCLISVCASFLCSLLVADYTTYPKAYNIYLIITSVSGLGFVVMLLLWLRTRKHKSKVIDKIKSQTVDE